MPFYVRITPGPGRKVITNKEYILNEEEYYDHQIVSDSLSYPNGQPILLKVPYGTGDENIRVRVKKNGSQAAVVLEDGDLLIVTTFTIGKPGQKIKISSFTCERLVKEDVFKSALLALISNPNVEMGKRYKRLAVDVLVNACHGQDPEVSFINHLGKRIKCFFDYRFKFLVVHSGEETKRLHFNQLYYKEI